ncbi:MAG TPA: hypothetical protein EYQ53_02640 [Candidatus Poseidoniales archaeon]|nr:MAG: hypothetical protein CXT69_06035 [Euryarchaeota archaeon]HIG03268.1 hypothetical protein [Candidatus Poseidoniales archaeon]HIK78849.1 hypothetical protein [Candidatus Poseidoniales archaeon]
MRRRLAAWPLLMLLLLAPLSLVPLSVSADNTGGIEAGPSSIGLSPSEPVMGGSVSISLTLFNDNSVSANDVQYSFYKDGISSSKLLESNVVTIPGNDFATVNTVWSGLAEGQRKVWISVEYNGDTPLQFYKEFTVAGLANLEVSLLDVTPSGLRNGDVGNVAALITNTGTVPSDISTTQIGIEGDSSSTVDVIVPALNPDETAWANTTLTFSTAGNWSVIAVPDAYDVVNEVAEGSGMLSISVNVLPDPDFAFASTLSITSPAESLSGPWTISGSVSGQYLSQTTLIQIGFQVMTSGPSPTISPLEIAIDPANTSTAFQFQLNSQQVAMLDAGEYALQATIDPFSILTQSDTTNDQTTGMMTIRPIPNVVLDPTAHPSSTSRPAGESVTWTVVMQNTGDITVNGRIDYSWEGQNLTSEIINIDAYGSMNWDVTLITAQNPHDAHFVATWVAHSTSYDADTTDSTSSGQIVVTSDLSLTFLANTGTLTSGSADGFVVDPPLSESKTYAYTIGLVSSGIGEETFSCRDGNGDELHQVNVSISLIGEGTSITCIFTIETNGDYGLSIVALDSSAQTHSRTWSVLALGGDGDDEVSSGIGLVLILGIIVFGLVIISVAAFILTRDPDEEIERGIYDYCPACDGELVGDETECPYCSFNLKKARRRFHDCETCGENIPSMISHCSFCGSEQDNSSFYETRERHEKALPAVEESGDEEDDEDAIVTGSADFDTEVTEFGYDAEQLGDEWDEQITAAETEMAEMEARWDAENAEIMEGEEDLAEGILSAGGDTFSGETVDEILSGKEKVVHLQGATDDGKKLSASDAGIREKYYEITGEDGVKEGDKVNIGLIQADRGLVGNELPEDAMDFSFEDDEFSVKKPRRATRRKKSEMGECGACGADLAMDADECGTCGAKYT